MHFIDLLSYPPPKGWFAVGKITAARWNQYRLSYENNYHLNFRRGLCGGPS